MPKCWFISQNVDLLDKMFLYYAKMLIYYAKMLIYYAKSV